MISSYKLTPEDLDKCVAFAVDMFKKGSTTNRLTGERRGLGKMIDDWVGGKAVEIGAENILESLSAEKKLILDFRMYNQGEAADKPDIIKVIDGDGRERDPNLYIEIKNYGEGERWVGLREEQLKTIQQVTQGRLDTAYLVYGQIDIDPSAGGKLADLLGAYFKEALDEGHRRISEPFAEIDKFSVKIRYIMSVEELNSMGAWFYPKENYLLETDLFVLPKRIGQQRIPVTLSDGKIPYEDYGGKPYPDNIGDLTVQSGQIEMFRVRNPKSYSYYVTAKSDSEIFNRALGTYKLSGGNTYKFQLRTAGRNDEIYHKSLWIADRCALELFGTQEKLESYAKKIMRDV
jgi:hypothetical protein